TGRDWRRRDLFESVGHCRTYGAAGKRRISLERLLRLIQQRVSESVRHANRSAGPGGGTDGLRISTIARTGNRDRRKSISISLDANGGGIARLSGYHWISCRVHTLLLACSP